MDIADAPTSAVLRIPKAGETLAADLRRRIIRGQLTAGDVLPTESALMQHYGVARPTLREAFRILESESLIEIRRGKAGARVLGPSRDVSARFMGMVLQAEGATVGEVLDARLVIEPHSAGHIARTRDDHAIQVLRAALDAEAAALSDDEAFGSASAHFHQVVVETAGNRALALMAAMIEGIIARTNTEAMSEPLDGHGPANHRRAHEAHGRLVSLVEAGAAADAELQWRQHLQVVTELHLRRIDSTRIVDLLTD
ncbi:FadR/GntR family transcriptional regulator [Pseudofrankia asymbiotica]|uniref:HTH gntR-type domain-containing protein n=1 Tax=Pseudofrankia asymbiotica TaxID=1834516 RepID=A0A1V2I5J5_9ACTN|nr:GntR family transcriptional regulator [Pseudofrankia asymbiotica]ONH26407.1 hypothetical protein BL253_24805 [Pseudofrankia asymbiotica]